MGNSGQLPDETLHFVTDLARGVSGDFAELGVYKADCFKRLVPIAISQGKDAHGFDSFCGMDKPDKFDGGFYPQGKLSVGGLEKFRKIMSDAGIFSHYHLYEGYVPDCLEKYDGGKFSFAYLDFDHYSPTVAGLNWILPRLSPGAVLGFDDFYDKDELASKAIKEFLGSNESKNFTQIHFSNHQLFLKKD